MLVRHTLSLVLPLICELTMLQCHMQCVPPSSPPRQWIRISIKDIIIHKVFKNTVSRSEDEIVESGLVLGVITKNGCGFKSVLTLPLFCYKYLAPLCYHSG